MKKNLLAPFRFRELGSAILLTNEVGDFNLFQNGIVERIFSNDLNVTEAKQLSELLITFNESREWQLLTLAKRVKDRITSVQRKLSYIILVPTLRCDLSCSYCQVSRAPLQAKGFDWGDGQLAEFENFITTLEGDSIKIEFQGGEPTLRPDLLKRIINSCEQKFSKTEFVVCTNLMSISKEMDEIYRKPNVLISTSIDGPEEIMEANRTNSSPLVKLFFKNFHFAVKEYGIHKISALPTITQSQLGNPKQLIDFYVSLGFDSIFLRPVNYQGFARKNYTQLSQDINQWNDFYRKALEYIFEINETHFFQEFYFSLVLKKIFGTAKDGFVDLRSPNFFMHDYCVMDFDGTIYPTDEARMLTRIGHMDLSIGKLGDALDWTKINDLNWNSFNQTDPDCTHCAYLPFCGIDLIDELSRYRKINIPKLETWFCRRHMMIFDFIFQKIAQKNIFYLDTFLKWIYQTSHPPKTYELFCDQAEI